MMHRRRFISRIALCLMTLPVVAEAQSPGKVYRIGFLRAGPPPTAWVEALRQGLRERGYIEGQNVVVEFPGTDSTTDQLPRLAEEFVRSKVDVILAPGAPPALAAKKLTTSVPIVFTIVYDPVELGLIQSLRRPGGNITGVAVSSADLFGKRLQLLKELVPGLRRVAVLWDQANAAHATQFKGAQVGARTLGLQLVPMAVHGPNEFEPAFKAVRGADGLLALDSPLFTNHRARLAGLATTSRLPAIYGYRELVDAGGLMSYGVHFSDEFRHAAKYIDQILKGTKPTDLPVEQPTKFELVINMKTVKTLGLAIPPSLMLRADEVIE